VYYMGAYYLCTMYYYIGELSMYYNPNVAAQNHLYEHMWLNLTAAPLSVDDREKVNSAFLERFSKT